MHQFCQWYQYFLTILEQTVVYELTVREYIV